MSVDVAAKYGIDMSQVRRVEGLVGRRLPDILEPLRQSDADFDQIKASLAHYQRIADDIDGLTRDLTQTRSDLAWQGAAGDSSRSAVDWILLVLGWIGAIILFIVAALLMLVALLLYAIGAILALIGKAISFLAACVAVIVTVLILIRTGGRGSSGRLTVIWETLKAVFSNVYVGAMASSVPSVTASAGCSNKPPRASCGSPCGWSRSALDGPTHHRKTSTSFARNATSCSAANAPPHPGEQSSPARRLPGAQSRGGGRRGRRPARHRRSARDARPGRRRATAKPSRPVRSRWTRTPNRRGARRPGAARCRPGRDSPAWSSHRTC